MMEALEAKNRVSFNAEIGTYLQGLFNMSYDGFGGVRDYILRMVGL